MTSKNNTKKQVVDQAMFNIAKEALTTNSVPEVMKISKLSETTVRRIKKSRNFTEYKGYIAASNGSKNFNEDELEFTLDELEFKKPMFGAGDLEVEEIRVGSVILFFLCCIGFVVCLVWLMLEVL